MADQKLTLPGTALSARSLLRLISRRVGVQESEDLLQETYLRALRHGQHETITDVDAFLRTTAVNLARDHLRRQATEKKYIDYEHDADSVAGRTAQPDAQIEALERLKLLLGAVKQLPPRCREVFLLRRFQGLHQAEIALRLGISRNMVEKHLRLALERLKAALD